MSAIEMSVERLEALLRGDEPRTAGEEQRAGLFASLRASAPVAPETLRQRALAAVPGQRARLGLSRRRLALAAIPVAAALAVGAALVHGFVSSGSRSANLRSSSITTVHGLSAGEAAAPNVPSSTSTKRASVHGSQRVLGPTGRYVHADANLSVRVRDRDALTKATQRATRIVGSLGGYAQSVRYESSHGGQGSAYLALRVPVGHVEKAVARLGALGTLLSQQISTQDLRQQLNGQSSKILTLRETIAGYEQALENESLPAGQRVVLQVRLTNAKRDLTRQRHARAGTLASAATSDISLTLTTRQRAAVVPYHESGRFDRLLGSAAGFLGLEGIGVLYALVVLSPVLVLGGLGWALVREKRRRDERRLLASA